MSKENKTKNEDTIPIGEKEASVTDFTTQNADDKLADKIKNYIIIKFLTERDLSYINLNNDGIKEVFVNFITSHFCGTGGCTVLLLNSNLGLFTKSSPTRTLYLGTARKTPL